MHEARKGVTNKRDSRRVIPRTGNHGDKVDHPEIFNGDNTDHVEVTNQQIVLNERNQLQGLISQMRHQAIKSPSDTTIYVPALKLTPPHRTGIIQKLMTNVPSEEHFDKTPS